jgi:hypothetical protein
LADCCFKYYDGYRHDVSNAQDARCFTKEFSDTKAAAIFTFNVHYSGFISEHREKSFLIRDLSISPSDFRKRSFSIQDLNSASTLIGFAPLSVLKLPVAFDTSAMLKPLKGQILTALSLDTRAIFGLANREFASLLSLEKLSIFGLKNREFISDDFGTQLSHPMQPKGHQAAFVMIQDTTFLEVSLASPSRQNSVVFVMMRVSKLVDQAAAFETIQDTIFLELSLASPSRQKSAAFVLIHAPTKDDFGAQFRCSTN